MQVVSKVKSIQSIGLVGILLAVVFAGCIGTGDDAAGPQGPGAEVDDDTGGVAGRVTTDDLLPIPTAQVGLLSEGQTVALATTDEEGHYSLAGVQPGTYTIVAQALGYDSQARALDIQRGQVAEAHFSLGEVPTDEPYHTTDTRVLTMTAVAWKLTPQCIYTDVNTLAKTCGGIRLECDPSSNCEVNYEDEGSLDWHAIFAELNWEPQSGVSGRGFAFDMNAPNITRGSGGSINQADPYTFREESDEPPIRIRIDNPDSLLEREIPEDDWYGDWFYRLFAGRCDLGFCEAGLGPDFGLMMEARATVYITFFINGPAPDPWTALPDQ